MKKIVIILITSIITCCNVFATSFYKPSVTVAPMFINGGNIYEVTYKSGYNFGYSFNTEHGILNVTKNNRGWFFGIGTGIDYVTTIEEYNLSSTHFGNINTYTRSSVICIPAYITGQYIHNINKISFTCKLNVGYYGFICAWDKDKDFNFNTRSYYYRTFRNYGPNCSHIMVGYEGGVRFPIAKSGKYGISVTYAYNMLLDIEQPEMGCGKMSLNIKFDF